MAFSLPTLAQVLARRKGLRVLADLHGQGEATEDAIAGALRQNYAVAQVGDVTDRGPDSPRAIRAILNMVRRREGVFVPGNHCFALMRLVNGGTAKVKDDLADTMAQLEAAPDGQDLTRRFSNLVARSPLWRVTAGPGHRLFLAHAAFSPWMLQPRWSVDWSKPLDPRDPPAELAGPTVRDGAGTYYGARALYGQTTGEIGADGYPVRLYKWVDYIPDDVTVVIGHDIVDDRADPDEVFVRTSATRAPGAPGGRALHLDTGAWKRDGVSYLDIPFGNDGVLLPPNPIR